MPTAIVIGASSGIGREIALHLGARGFRVGIAARREAMLAEVAGHVGVDRCSAVTLDLTEADAAIRKFDELATALGEVDFVYLVAGDGYENVDLDWALEGKTLQTNCVGFGAMAGAALRIFGRQRRGHLIAVTSVAAVRPWGGAPAYGASKTFGSVYLEALRYWVARRRLPIFLTEVRPGFVDTAMMKAGKAFWVISPAAAARGVIAAAERRAVVAYVPGRWRFVACLMRMLPRWLYAKLG